MLKKLLCKRVITVAMATIVATGVTFGVSGQSASATPANPPSEPGIMGTIINTNYELMQGEIKVNKYATAYVNTTLDVRSKPEGTLIGSVYNKDNVYIHYAYIDEHGVGWYLVEYKITGTLHDAKMGWVHAQYVHYN